VRVLEIRAEPKTDPDGRRLRDLLEAIGQVERYAVLHTLTVHALAAIGVVLWVGVAFPAVLPDSLRCYALAGFAAVAAGTIAVLVLERRWQREQRRRMRENDVRELD
jgi:hypothetical protein